METVSEPIDVNSTRIAARRAKGLLWSCLALTGAVLLAWPVVAVVAARQGGAPTWLISFLAAAVCWFSAMLSLILAHRLQQKGAAMAGLLAGTLVRMALPLAVGMWAMNQVRTLAEGGFFGQIVVFYLLTLAVETWLSLGLAKAAMASKQVASTELGSKQLGSKQGS